MSRAMVTRVAGLVLMVLLCAVAVYPVLFWDPAAGVTGGEGFGRLREWSELSRSDGDAARREELQSSFGVRRSHLGKLWYTAADGDGRCWVLSVSPLAVVPEEAEDPGWCQG